MEDDKKRFMERIFQYFDGKNHKNERLEYNKDDQEMKPIKEEEMMDVLRK